MARILLVEDNPDLAAGIEYNLRLEGYDVRIAPSGRDAIAAYAEWHPDLVLLDLMLPDIDGYQVLQAIRDTERTTPVIILSARDQEADKVRGFRLDADQYVTKPFGVLELIERIGRCCGGVHIGPAPMRRRRCDSGRSSSTSRRARSRAVVRCVRSRPRRTSCSCPCSAATARSPAAENC